MNSLATIGRLMLKDKPAMAAAFVIFMFIVVACLAPIIAPHDPYEVHMQRKLEGPSISFPLGTDENGRCILSRLMYGARISMTVGLVSVGIGLSVGTFIGLMSGYFRSLDMALMRAMDVLLAVPSVLLAIAIVAALGFGIYNMMIAVGIAITPTFARLTRSQVLSIREQTYVEAARSLGATNLRIIFRHILPNCVSALIVYATLYMGSAIMSASLLSFLGLGVQPPTAEWGSMVSTARHYLQIAPHAATFPSLAILVVVLSFNLLGDAFRDALDPKLRI